MHFAAISRAAKGSPKRLRLGRFLEARGGTVAFIWPLEEPVSVAGRQLFQEGAWRTTSSNLSQGLYLV